MSNFNVERLAGMVQGQCDANTYHELVTEIEMLIGCGHTYAVSVYDRLKVIRRVIAGMVEDGKDARKSWGR